VRRQLVGVVAVLAFASGCGGGDSSAEDQPDPLETSEASAGSTLPEGVPTTPPPEPPDRPANTTESALEFAEFFVRTYQYTYAVRDAQPLMDLVPDEQEMDSAQCQGCPDTKKNIKALQRERRYLVRGRPTFSETLQTGQRGRQRIVSMRYNTPAGSYVYDGGSTKPAPALEQVHVETLLYWQGDHWVVFDYGFPKSAGE